MALGTNSDIEHLISNGFKNMVFSVKGNSDILLRVGFVSDGNQTVSFRTESSIDIFKIAVKVWCKQVPDNSREFHILSKMIEYEDHVTVRDVVTMKDLEREFFFQAESNTLSNMHFGTAGSIRRVFIPLPLSNIISSSDSISLILDYHIRLSGDFNHLWQPLPELELIAFLYCYLADQISFYSQLKSFHIDGHAGNILYKLSNDDEKKKISFVWTDFGKTSSSSNVSNQFRNSLLSVQNRIFSISSNFGYDRIIKMLRQIIEISDTYRCDFIMKVSNIEKLQNNVSDTILNHFSRAEVTTFLTQLVPSSSFGITYLISEIDKQNERISQLSGENSHQSEQIAQLSGENSHQSEQIAHQSEQIAHQSEQIAHQSEQIAQLIENISKLSEKHEKGLKKIPDEIKESAGKLYRDSAVKDYCIN